MVIRRNSKHDSNPPRPSKRNQQQRERRQLFLENLEDRRLLHGGGQHVPISGSELDEDAEAGFEIVGAQLNNGDLLNTGDILNESPRDVTLHFSHDVKIDPTSLGGISLMRSGPDGQFGRASATTDFGSNGAVELSFMAMVDGDQGNGIEVVFTRSDHENASGPRVEFEDLDDGTLEEGEVHSRVTIDLNVNELNPSTIDQVREAVADHPIASQWISTELLSGDDLLDVSALEVTSYSPIRLSGSDDLFVQPGYVGVEGGGHDVVFRFRESLQDDTYRLIVNGGGTQPLRNDVGEPFLAGVANELIDFTIDRGPQVLAVVPQPVTRDEGGLLVQQRDQIHVYFNEDDLNRESAETASLYQLIFTANTADNSDDVIHNPVNIEYSSATDMAALTFAAPLDQLSGGGAYRLRVGDMSSLPGAPMGLELSSEAASTFGQALSIGKNLQVNVDGTQLQDGQSIELIAEGGESLVLEFDEGLMLQLGSTGIVDGNHFTLHHSSGSSTFEFDDDATSVSGNVVIQLDAADDLEALTEKVTLAIHAADMGLFPTNLGSGSIHLGGDESTSADTVSTIDLTAFGSPGVINAGATAVSFRPESSFDSSAVAASLVAAIEDADLGIEVKRFNDRVAIVGANVVRNTDLTVVGDLSLISDGDLISIDNGDGLVLNLEVDTGVIVDASGAPVDGHTFSVTAGGQTKTFEVEVAGGTGNPDNIPVFITSGFDVGIVNAVGTAFGELSPQALGDGRVAIGTGVDYSVDLSGAPSLSSVGENGVASGHIALPIVPSGGASAEQIAAMIASEGNGFAGFTIEADGKRVMVSDQDKPFANFQINLTGSLNAVFQLASDIDLIGLDSMILSSSINPQKNPLTAPGGDDEPGHREIRAEHHLHADADSASGITNYNFSFPLQYGYDPAGNVLLNAITEKQKERAREIFEIYSEHLGVTFVETENQGFQIVTGDMRALDEMIPIGPGGVLGVAGNGKAIMDLQDFDDAGDDIFGGPWFQTAIHEVGHLLGLGHTYELPAYTAQGSEPNLSFGQPVENIFVSGHDRVHGLHLYQAESNDIDVYELDIAETGTLSIETIAERLADPSSLDTAIAVYRDVVSDGITRRVLVAKNDDYFSEDSALEIDVTAGHYYIGVSSTGNTNYDPRLADSGQGGTSEGAYDLRLNFTSGEVAAQITDVNGNALDGDADGVAGGNHNFWFHVAEPANTIFVDKTAEATTADGTSANPYTEIDMALASANSGDIVRVVANGGADGDIATVEDNEPYLVGFNSLNGNALTDGGNIIVPQGVSLVIDANVIIKSRRGRIAVGSSTELIDRSDSSLQVLGVPRLMDANGNVIRDLDGIAQRGSVVFTSLYDDEHGQVDASLIPTGTEAMPGDWGGLDIRNDFDKGRVDRHLHANDGVFLTTINNAEIMYGGGNVVVDGKFETVDAISLRDARPTISNNVLSDNAGPAIAANPDSFEETNFNAPYYQTTSFTLDYDRVGPEIHGNQLSGNSIDGLLVKVDTPAGMETETLTLTGGWDDLDIVHVLAENLEIEGTPGGHISDSVAPPAGLVQLAEGDAGSLFAGAYNYRMTYVDADGNESMPSAATVTISVTGPTASIDLSRLPIASGEFEARRLYRSQNTGDGPYVLVTELNANATSFTDVGGDRGGVLTESASLMRSRLDASLTIRPGVVVKLDGARIDVGVGAQLLAEGRDGNEIVFTSVRDSRYGAGGSFDTTKQDPGNIGSGAVPGDWGGIYASPVSRLNLDHAKVSFGGGNTRIEGDFASVNAVEVQQAEARIANTLFENNADGMGNSVGDRIGRDSNSAATIFVRGSQSVLIGNEILNNLGPAISIDVNSLNADHVMDSGRQTQGQTDDPIVIEDANGNQWESSHSIDGVDEFYGLGNQGALVRDNVLSGNGINGMHVRGGTLTTEGVWDDTDIVHVVFDTIYVTDFHTAGGLRLESAPDESLVVKLDSEDAGFTATGNPLDINDRIGGSLNILGQQGKPVVITSVADDEVGAGYLPSGQLQVDTNGDSVAVTNAVASRTSNITVTYAVPGIAGGPIDDVVQEAIVILEAALLDPVDLEFEMTISDLPAPRVGEMWTSATVGEVAWDDVRDAMIQDATNSEFPLVSQLPTLAELRTVPADTAGSTMYIAKANAKALGMDTDSITWDNANGQCAAECDGFFILDDQYDASNLPRVDLVVHEIGHALGFISSLGWSTDNLSTLDMFRLEPGQGGIDFTNAPRVTDQGRVAVFYDGQYDPIAAGVTGVPGLSFGEIPMSTGAGGDGNQPSHFKNEPLIGGVELGLMDPQMSVTQPDPVLYPNDLSVLGLMGWDVTASAGGRTPRPGDWSTVTIGAHANDRNVQAVTESEIVGRTDSSSRNDVVDYSQFLGSLAGQEFSADDNQRLGFEIHGLLESPADADVYTFDGLAGTEVWFDIDNTSASLDSVISILDASGNVVASSNDSAAESTDPTLLVNNGLPANHVNPLDKSMHEIKDHWTTNPKDAGFRVVLPGNPGTADKYHVQVSSNGGRGNYELQIRLRETDEIAGSSVWYSDIRYGTTGLTINGAPLHSPLSGEATESSVANDSVGTAQNLGNLLASDRATLSTAGRVDGGGDVDFYEFDVSYNSVQQQGTGAAVVLDLDYSDGLARVDTSLSLFDDAGNLIYVGTDSSIADDRPAPLHGTDLDDLSRGTVGPLDPFIGSVELPVGSYSVAVSPTSQMPTELQQYTLAGAANPLLRLEPNLSVARVAEDRLDTTNNEFSTAEPARYPVLIDNTTMVPYHLGDVALFVTTDNGLNQTGVYTVDAFTGTRETTVHDVPVPFETGDMAIRPDGNMFAFTTQGEGGAIDDAAAGNYIQIDTGDGSVVNVGDDDVETRQSDAAGANQAADHGMHYDAMTYGTLQGALQGFVVGHRPNGAAFPGATPDVDSRRNILYRFDPATGEVTSAPQGDRTGAGQLAGANTDKVERGILDTSVDDLGLANKWLLSADATLIDVVTDATVTNIADGAQFVIDDGNPLTANVVFEMNSGPEVYVTIDPAAGLYVRDGDSMVIDGTNYEFDTGEVLVVDAANGALVGNGNTVTLVDDNGDIGTFEFTKDGSVSGLNLPVVITNTTNQEDMTVALVDAINASSLNLVASVLTAGSNRITLENTHTTNGASVSGTAVSIDGSVGSVSGGNVISVEENSTPTEFSDQLKAGFSSIATINLGVKGQRVNFAGATNADFSELIARGVFADQGSDGNLNDPTADSILFLADDTADDIAQKIMNAVAAAGFTVTANGGIIELDPTDPGLFVSADLPLRVGGGGPGGDITGLSFIGTQMFAVSDAGGFYRVIDPMSNNARLEYIGSSAPALQGIPFAGLTSGPVATEGGRYQDMLFGIDVTGRLHAFDTDGIPQPVFVDGATNLRTGTTSIEGVHFGTLETNLWNITASRGPDAGHGTAVAFDGTRDPSAGGNSLHFGTGATGDIDFPGGAHGSVESREFSLVGYSEEDQPTLYFNYFVDSEDAAAVTDQDGVVSVPARDTFRAFIGDATGQWKLLNTNNETDDPTHEEDEVDLNLDVQVAFDNTGGWRQVRVSLGEYAGRDHLKLRFDFSTAGSMNLGDATTAGSELRALPAAELLDGAQIVVDGEVLEIDLGYTLSAPTGAAMVDGSVLTVDYGAGVNGSFEVDKNGSNGGGNIIAVSDSMTAEQVADIVAKAIVGGVSLPAIQVNVSTALESNDTLATAIPVNLNGLPGTFEGKQGKINDNPNLITEPDADVDLFQIALTAGSTINVDTNTDAYATAVNTYIRIFDADGNALTANDNGTAPGETPGTDSYLQFTAPTDGDYYIGVSGAGNTFYDPTVAESGVAGSTGSYDLLITVSTESGIVQVVNNLVNLPGAVSVGDNGTGLGLSGTSGVTIGTTPISIHAGMNAADVADRTARVLESIFAGGQADIFKTHNEIVRVIGHDVDDSGPFGLTDSLPGDKYGAFNQNLRGQNNAVEGVYIDDIVVGFAERGELVTNAAADATFGINANAEPSDIDNGEYQLEIRRGTQYVDFDDDGDIFLLDAHDPNDRLSQSLTLVASDGFGIADGQTFELSDGVNRLTFEYNDIFSGTGVTEGNVAIDFDPSETNIAIAKRIRDLINSSEIQNVLEITASFANGAVNDDDDATRESEDVRIHLFGSANAQVVQAEFQVGMPTVEGNVLRDAIVGDGLTIVGDAVYSGGALSAALFTGGRNVLGMDSGVVLSTGDARIADDANADSSTTGISSGQGDLDLDDEFNVVSMDTTTLEFDVEMEDAGDLFVNFIFASEEYNEFANSAYNDVLAIFVDDENIALIDTEPVSINSINGGNPLGANPQNGDLFNNNSPVDDGQYLNDFAYDGFTDILTVSKSGLTAGTHHIKIAISDVADSRLDSAVFIQASSIATTAVPVSSGGILGTVHDSEGDRNTRREQGQIVIHGNHIQHQLDYGISVDATSRDANGNPVAGPVRNLRELNTFNLVPGATITNNVIDSNGDGVLLSGEADAAGQQTGPVSMARLVNNTIVGDGTGTGIEVTDNASPTLLNNVISSFATGIEVGTNSTAPVLGGNLYHNNNTDVNGGSVGSFAIVADATEELFVGQANGNYYPADGASVLDSSVKSLRDRSVMTTVKQPVGIGTSPVLAPATDQLGQLRVDDPAAATPTGLGANVFIDRGAIDRSDFVGPRAVFVDPVHYNGQSSDIPTQSEFEIKSSGLPEINIRLVDGVNMLDYRSGSGIDDASIDSQTVTLTKNGTLLELNKDYLMFYDTTNDIIKLRPVSGLFESDSTYVVSLTNVSGHILEMVDGSQQLDGDSIDITDREGKAVTFEYDSGFVFHVRQGYTLYVPVGGVGINDGDTIVVGNSDETVTFEFDRDGVVDVNNTAIEYTLSTTSQQVVNKMSAALTEAELGLMPRDLGEDYLLLGSNEDHTLDASNSSIIQLGFASSVNHDEGFIIQVGDEQRYFLFEDENADSEEEETTNEGEEDGVTKVVIEYNASQSQDEIAENIASSINDEFEQLSPTAYDGGVIHVGGTLGTHVTLNESTVSVLGAPGTNVGFGLAVNDVSNLVDGQTFTIASGPGVFERFEFDNDGVVVAENHRVAFNEDTTVDSLAIEIALRIDATDLGLQTVHVGAGNIALHGSTSAHSLDLVGTPLTQYGTAGADSAVPMPFIPHSSFTEQDMASMVAGVIATTDTLDGVTAQAIDESVHIGGAASVTGATVLSFTGVQDIAGNKLLANDVDGTTEIILNLTSGMDHADAQDYDNAAHEVISDLRLGDTVDTEPEPIVNADATGDLSDDGVVFEQILIVDGIGRVTVTTNGVLPGEPAYLNAWFDRNADGDFAGSEQIIDGQAVFNGSQTFTFNVGADAVIGNTIARFRISPVENVAPIGEVVGGEVEDYQVTVFRSAWQNPAIAEDVNFDGYVSPIDALLVINHLNLTDPVALLQPLPIPENGNEPPPYLDVDGDNRIFPIDALMVINKIAGSIDTGAEGEFTQDVGVATSRMTVGTLTVVHDTAELQQVELERAREQQFSELGLHGINRLEDVLSDIADDVQSSEGNDLDEFFANIRFE